MPLYDLNEVFVPRGIFDVPRLRLKKDEMARVVIVGKLGVEITHYIEPDGTTRRDGTPGGGSYVCLGDPHVVLEGSDGRDPARCPACRVAEFGSSSTVKYARRRFVAPVAAYGLTPEGSVRSPIVFTYYYWVFSDTIYRFLRAKFEEFDFDVEKHDVILTGENAQFGQVDITISPQFRAGSDASALSVLTELRANVSTDITRLLGKSISYEAMETVIAEATRAMRPGEMETALDSVFGSSEVSSPPERSIPASESPFPPEEELDALIRELEG